MTDEDPYKNNREMTELIYQYALTNAQVAEMTGYSIDSVIAWRVSRKAQKSRIMPDRALKLLKLEIKDRKLTHVK